jgi:hypothetical protein
MTIKIKDKQQQQQQQQQQIMDTCFHRIEFAQDITHIFSFS